MNLNNSKKKNKDKSILLVGDFNSCSNTWNKNIKQSSKTLEYLINRHGPNNATDAPYTFKQSDNSGKSTVDLTLTRGLKNLKVKTKKIETIKTASNHRN